MKEKIMLLMILLAGIAKAGSISMVVSTENVFFPDNMNVSLQNMGDETAWNVRLTVLSDKFIIDEIFLRSLDPYQKNNFSFAIKKTGDALSGSYPAVILTRYEDANGYPFSSVSPNYIIYGAVTNSDIHASIQDSELATDGNIKMKLRNMGNKEISPTIRLFLPLEIKSGDEKNLHLAPKSEGEVSFQISNFGALVGSSYTVLAAVEYDNGEHYSTFATGIVRIVENKEVFDQDLLIILLFILIIAVAVYQLKGRFNK